jgi:hypothetical protein
MDKEVIPGHGTLSMNSGVLSLVRQFRYHRLGKEGGPNIPMTGSSTLFSTKCANGSMGVPFVLENGHLFPG